MDAAQRRLKSIASHVFQYKVSFVHGIDSNHHAAFEQPTKSLPSSPVVIGGMVLDIVAKPETNPNPGTTTPGRIEHVSGGVARNVVECMTKLGIKPFMISTVGFDIAGDSLLKLWESAELPTEGLLRQKNITTPVVSNIFDCKGELIAGVASVHAVEKFLTPAWISKFELRIRSAPILMVDANLGPDALRAVCRMAAKSNTPVWFEPVSVTKSSRIASISNYVTCASPNEIELIAMANALSRCKDQFVFTRRDPAALQPIQLSFDRLKPAVLALLEKGIRLLVVTIGMDGIFLCFREGSGFSLKGITMKGDRSGRLNEAVNKYCPPGPHKSIAARYPVAFHLPAAPAAPVVNLTGAGDCLVGGMIAALCSGLNIMRSAAVGVAAAKAAVESFDNVPADISMDRIALDAHEVLSAAKQLMF